MQGNIEGVSQFEDFAEDIETVKAKVPVAIGKALNMTAQDYKEALTDQIQASSTSKGGTFNSETSDYSPGGTNDSSDDGYHISQMNAWHPLPNEGPDRTNLKQVRVYPREEVRDRAKWMEFGTSSHGPSGNTPMYFNVDGATVVVSNTGTFDSPGGMQGAEGQDIGIPVIPGEVDGVEPNHFFTQAAERVRANGAFKRNMRKAVREIFLEEFNIA